MKFQTTKKKIKKIWELANKNSIELDRKNNHLISTVKHEQFVQVSRTMYELEEDITYGAWDINNASEKGTLLANQIQLTDFQKFELPRVYTPFLKHIYQVKLPTDWEATAGVDTSRTFKGLQYQDEVYGDNTTLLWRGTGLPGIAPSSTGSQTKLDNGDFPIAHTKRAYKMNIKFGNTVGSLGYIGILTEFVIKSNIIDFQNYNLFTTFDMHYETVSPEFRKGQILELDINRDGNGFQTDTTDYNGIFKIKGYKQIITAGVVTSSIIETRFINFNQLNVANTEYTIVIYGKKYELDSIDAEGEHWLIIGSTDYYVRQGTGGLPSVVGFWVDFDGYWIYNSNDLGERVGMFDQVLETRLTTDDTRYMHWNSIKHIKNPISNITDLTIFNIRNHSFTTDSDFKIGQNTFSTDKYSHGNIMLGFVKIPANLEVTTSFTQTTKIYNKEHGDAYSFAPPDPPFHYDWEYQLDTTENQNGSFINYEADRSGTPKIKYQIKLRNPFQYHDIRDYKK